MTTETAAITGTTPETTSTGDTTFWDRLRGDAFDPAPLAQLAAHMRDGTWLDVRTDDGLLQRVRITEIRVYVHGEDIIFRQEWFTPEDDFRHRQVPVESEAIWRVNPSRTELRDVKLPPGCESRPGDPEDVCRVALLVVGGEMGISADVLCGGEFRGRQLQSVVDARHCCLLILHQMTDEGPVETAQRLGYKSQQPLLTALWKMTRRNPAELESRFRREVRRRAKLVRDQLGFDARTTAPGRESLL